MSLIITDINNWVLERCSTKEDIQYYINKLQELKDNWVDETEDESKPEYKKYCVHVGYRYAIDLNVMASSLDKAKEIGDEYASALPITNERFYCADGDVDAWEEEFDEEDADVVEDDYE